MKYLRLIKILLLLIGAVILIDFSVALWSFFRSDDSFEFHHYSFTYWRYAPNSIRRLPMNYCSEPIYHYSPGDGLKLFKVTRRCHTSDPSAAFSHYRDLFLKQGYRISNQGVDHFQREYAYFEQKNHGLGLLVTAPDQFEIIHME